MAGASIAAAVETLALLADAVLLARVPCHQCCAVVDSKGAGLCRRGGGADGAQRTKLSVMEARRGPLARAGAPAELSVALPPVWAISRLQASL